MGTQKVEARVRLPQDVVRHLLWYFGDTNLGMEPGHFVQRLIVLISGADPVNRGKIADHWPGYVYGFEIVTQRLWGLDWLRALAKAELDGADEMLPLHTVVDGVSSQAGLASFRGGAR